MMLEYQPCDRSQICRSYTAIIMYSSSESSSTIADDYPYSYEIDNKYPGSDSEATLATESEPAINKLSEKALLNIFSFLIITDMTQYTLPWDWTTITRVCRSWRKISIHHPELWFHISNMHDYGRINTLLSRSQSHPLSVYIEAHTGLQGSSFKNSLALIMSHSQRFHRLKVVWRRYITHERHALPTV